jgi:hypothetical protein
MEFAMPIVYLIKTLMQRTAALCRLKSFLFAYVFSFAPICKYLKIMGRIENVESCSKDSDLDLGLSIMMVIKSNIYMGR